MIRQNIKLVLTNGKYLFGVFLIVFFTGIVLLYQEKVTPLEGEYKADALTWLDGETDPIEAIQNAREELFLDYEPRFTDSFYNEFLLWDNLSSYVEERLFYHDILSSMINNYKITQKISVSTDVMRDRSRIAQEKYEELKDIDVTYGNFISAEKFLKFGLAEVAFLLLLLYSAYFLIIHEREKGISPLVHSTKNGGIRYYLYKLAALLVIASILFVLIYAEKFIIYSALFGFPDFNISIQSMDGYLSCPYSWSIGSAILNFLIYKFLFACLLTAVLLFISSLALSEASICFCTAGIALLYLSFGVFIPDTSRFILIRDGGLIKLWDFDYWCRAYYYAYFGGDGDRIYHMNGFTFPAVMLAVYTIIFITLGLYLHKKGLRKSSSKGTILGRLWKYRKGVYVNEGEYLLFQKGVLLVLSIALVAGFIFTDTSDKRISGSNFEAEYLALVNDMTYEDACAWLDEKLSEFDQLNNELINLSIDLSEGKIDTETYDFLSNSILIQLQFRSYVEALKEQTEGIDHVIDTYGIQPKFNYTSFTDEINGEKGVNDRLMLGMLIASFLILGGMSVFPMDKQLGMNRLICTTKNGKKSITSRIIWICSLTFLFSLAVHLLWLWGIMKQYNVNWNSELMGFNAPAQTMPYYQGMGLEITVRAAIILNIVWISLRWAIISFAAIAISLFVSNAVWMEMIGIVILICPLALRLTEVRWVEKLPYFSSITYGFGDMLLDGIKLITVPIFLIITFIVCHAGEKSWGR